MIEIKLLNDPLFLIALCIVLGQLWGSKHIGHFQLGSSATLFVGLIVSYLIAAGLDIRVAVPGILFSLSLIGFIGPVGLMASKNIGYVLKTYGIKFLILSIIVTLSGALSTFVQAKIFTNIQYSVLGTYVGALTSSPGLATALELAKTSSMDQSAAVGLGYSIAYIPGVLMVILFAQWTGRNHGAKKGQIQKISAQKNQGRIFRLSSFILVILVGMMLGSFEISIGRGQEFSLGITGGVLLSSLFFGSWKRTQIFDFDHRQLGMIRNISLNMFLAIVGLNYGYDAISAIQEFGLQLLLIGLITGMTSIFAGYILGRYVLKIDLLYLVGGICGGMTSTPGLAVAIDTFEREEVTSGYGATYPFALLLMIIFTKLLFVL